MLKTMSFALGAALLIGFADMAGAAEPMKMDHGATMPGAGVETPADKAFAAANDAMMKGMDVKPSSDADRDFVAMMLPHHQGAVDMARVEIRYGHDPVLRKLATDVIAAQEKEIALMRAWQEKHAK